MKRLLAVMVLTVAAVFWLCGCSVSKENSDKVKDLDFTVVVDAEIPKELKDLIEQKKQNEFKLTYTNEQALYIVVGYGKQATGGYSIQVKELYLTPNSIYLDTEMVGPSKDETVGMEPSYPYIVLKTELREEPVVFQ